jgi:hypothetical protein
LVASWPGGLNLQGLGRFALNFNFRFSFVGFIFGFFSFYFLGFLLAKEL